MSTQDTHVDFIQARLPTWLKRASRADQERFKVLAQQLQRDSDALNALLVDLPAPETFTRNLLQAQPEIQAWPAVNGTGGAADAIRRARVRRGAFRYEPSLSVVEAAMRNYAPTEAVTGSDFDNTGQLFIQGKPQEFRPWNVPSDTVLLPTTPAEFARLCRRMDAGGAYRTVLERRLPRIGAEVPAVASAYMAYARSLLTHDAYEAKLDGRLDETGERLLAYAGIQLKPGPLRLWPARSSRWICCPCRCSVRGCIGACKGTPEVCARSSCTCPMMRWHRSSNSPVCRPCLRS